MPNVGDESITNLDEAGIVYIGSEVNQRYSCWKGF